MTIKLLSTLLLILYLTIGSAQTKPKKKTTSKKSTKTTLVKETETEENIDKQIVEEAPESNPLKVKYRRSSLYTLMLETPTMPYGDSIKKYFIDSKIPDKFNNHNLGSRIITKLPSPSSELLTSFSKPTTSSGLLSSLTGGESSEDTSDSPAPVSNQMLNLLAVSQTSYAKEYLAERKRLEVEAKEIGVTKKKKILEYIDKRVVFDAQKQQKEEYDLLPQEVKDRINAEQKEINDIAKALVAKWFDRSPKGGFNMSLIKSRGNYDATVMDIAKARASKRGLAMLGDAGEDLIKNTFVLINEFKYTDKEEVAKKTSGILNIVSQAAAFVPGASNVSNVSALTSVGVTIAGKGYIVKTKGHLYRLDWNDEVAAKFYADFWATDKTITPERKKAFDETDIFKLIYVGTDESWADVQSSIFTNKTDLKLVERATMKAMDAVIFKLQKNHDEFKTKTPIYTNEPLTAKIGLKEGVSYKSVFDVLEQQVNEEGIMSYVTVGQVKIDDKFPIWDNRYGADVENPDTTTDKTYLKKISGKELFPGMLLVQKKGK
ncbi:hypothetical protein [Flavobacterium hydrophilum]|uniref:Uncharacterized protein n=1 Tax=Flavobacterium hydrophilum TaxID=2211445 RepID=A0A2V4C2E0_9FLAO|nr:hypothetical protein [Flavobacterium hydrophilum]PXY45481.1 hypothetical protein DMB68_12445 [Flavobacterium hydrophilum]